MRRAVREARAEAANLFESVLRALALDVDGLAVRPQVAIGAARPDLVDEEARIVLEADSFEWHGGRAALRLAAVVGLVLGRTELGGSCRRPA